MSDFMTVGTEVKASNLLWLNMDYGKRFLVITSAAALKLVCGETLDQHVQVP